IRYRPGEHVRVLGLGGWTLLDGVGDRTLDDAGDRSGELSRHAGRLSRDGRALSHGAVRQEPARADGLAQYLVCRLRRRAHDSGVALRTIPQAVSGVSATVDDGE